MILHTAVWLVVAALQHLPDSPEQQEALSRCLALRSQFAPFMGRIT
ncbi:MAG: hypothetical protein JO202_05300 [Ktedonobacteraceae bacterium]|nr:hypothetical protein [Ktedonobacteraceae bacterium]